MKILPKALLIIGVVILITLPVEAGKYEMDELIVMLKDPVAIVRRDAVIELGELGNEAKDAVPVLMELLYDEEDYVRFF